LFTGLPNLADKAFVVGFLVPVLAALAAFLGLFQELPVVAGAIRYLSHADDLAKLTASGAGVIIAALLLLLVNRPIYRSLEGYIGPLASRPFKRAARDAWSKLEAERERLDAAYDEADADNEAALQTDDEARKEACKEALEAANLALRAHLRDFRKRYPREKRLVLPTRFGNANRAFETYAANAFDVEAILVWPRLSAILPDGLQGTLTDVRAQVNGLANIAVLLTLIVAARLGFWVIEAAWLTAMGVTIPAEALEPRTLVVAAASIVLLLSLAVLAYDMAVERVYALGDQVKVAFDLHLLRLPAKLGYALPLADADREKLWAALEDAWDFQSAVQGFKPMPPAEPGGAAGGDD
jgi:hypothetical protein